MSSVREVSFDKDGKLTPESEAVVDDFLHDASFPWVEEIFAMAPGVSERFGAALMACTEALITATVLKSEKLDLDLFVSADEGAASAELLLRSPCDSDLSAALAALNDALSELHGLPSMKIQYRESTVVEPDGKRRYQMSFFPRVGGAFRAVPVEVIELELNMQSDPSH